MRSIRTVVQQEPLPVPGPPFSMRLLCGRYGVSSLMGMIVAHDAHLRALEQKSFHQDIVTPSGTPLGGWIDLVVHGNGDYTVAFHTHSSSALGDFDFDLRGYLSAPGCPVFFFHHSGHVSGVASDDYPESNNSALIALYWPQIQSGGAFTAAKDYRWGGVAGTLDRLADDLINLRILDFASGVAGAPIGVVIGVTKDAISWINANLGPGGTIGILAGVAVFAAAAALGSTTAAAIIFGSVAGAAVGALTDALISYREIQGAEINLATKVFANSIPYNKIMLTNLGMGRRAFTAPGVDGKIYCNLASAFQNPLDAQGGAYPAPGELLIHELTHVWQIANGSFLPGFVCSGIVNQADYTFGDDVYKYGMAGQGWSAFNLEQQGAIVDQWFAGTLNPSLQSNQRMYAPMDATNLPGGFYENPYYLYIHDNILAKSLG